MKISCRKLLIYTTLALTLSGAPSFADPLNSPYKQPPAAISYTPQPCQKPDSPVRDMIYESFYTNKKEGRSHINQKALDKYREDTKPIRAFEINISQHAEQFMVTGNPSHAECVVEWLYHWANGQALLGKTNAQGIAVRKWTLGVLGAAYTQINQVTGLEKKKTDLIDEWLSLLAQSVKYDYSRGPEMASRNSNHMYWAAWAVMITGIALNDDRLFDWAIGEYKKAIDQIEKDGTLPLEMARQSKAFNYHVFSTGPLVMMAEAGEENGRGLYQYKDGMLHILVGRVISELETGQAYIKEKTGEKQNLTGTITPGQLAWMEPYRKRFNFKRTDPWLDKLRPMKQRRLGGNLTLLYAADQ